MNNQSNAHHPLSHASASAAAAADPPTPCGCEPGAIRRGDRCSSEAHGIAPHQVVPVAPPARSTVKPGKQGEQKLLLMERAWVQAMTRLPAGLTDEQRAEWTLVLTQLVPTFSIKQSLQAYAMARYHGAILVVPADVKSRNTGKKRQRAAVAPTIECGFIITDSDHAHALRDGNDLAEAMVALDVFDPLPEMSAAAMNKILTGLPVLCQIGLPAALLQHAIRLCGGVRVPSAFVQFARTIHTGHVGLEAVPLVSAKGNPVDERTLCFWLDYFVRNHVALDLSPAEMREMVEALRQDGVFVPLLADWETVPSPELPNLIVQIVQLNRTIEQQQNQHQFPMLFVGQQPQVEHPAAAAAAAASSSAASSSLISHQAVLAAAGAASAAGAPDSQGTAATCPGFDHPMFIGPQPSDLASPVPSSSFGGAMDSPGSHASSLAPTFAASSVSRSSTPSRCSSEMSDGESESQAASQGHPASIFGDDQPTPPVELDLKFGPVEGNRDDIDETEHNDKKQRRSACLPPVNMQSIQLMQQARFGQAAAPDAAAGPLDSPVAPADSSHLPLSDQPGQSVSEMASGSDLNAVALADSMMNLDAYCDSSPVGPPSTSPRAMSPADMHATDFVTY